MSLLGDRPRLLGICQQLFWSSRCHGPPNAIPRKAGFEVFYGYNVQSSNKLLREHIEHAASP